MHLLISVVATGLAIMLTVQYLSDVQTKAAGYTPQHKETCVCGVSRRL